MTKLITVIINRKLMPIDRGVDFEEPLDDFLDENQIGEVMGGGTQMLETGEVQNAEISIHVNPGKNNKPTIQSIIEKLEELGAPKGSQLINGNDKIAFGNLEGIGIYMKSVGLPEEVYETSDVTFVVSEIKRLINDDSEGVNYWLSEPETAIYFYKESF